MNTSVNILQIIRQRAIIYSAGLMLLLVITNAGILLYNNHVLAQTTAINKETQHVKTLLTQIWDEVVRNIDLGVRGYALTQDDGLLVPYRSAIKSYPGFQQELYVSLQKQGYPDAQDFIIVKKGFDDYLEYSASMIELTRQGNDALFKQELKQDRGLALWRLFSAYAKEVRAYEDAVSAEATARYNAANAQMSFVQILLAIIGTPTLLFIIIRIRRDMQERRQLFEELEENNRQYLFDPGTAEKITDEREIINSSIENFQKAASFINQISTGNLQVDWEGLSEHNKSSNQTNLAGELIQMREKMKQLKADDAKRMWATEGLAQFSEIIRTYQHDLQTLCDQTVSFIVKYLSAQQGSIFLYRDNDGDKHLKMTGCYAFNKKKFIDKRIEIGQGLVGQVYLEQQPVMLTEIPQAYTFITSGLGETTPTCLLVVPMKYNEKVEAVIEVAGFQVYEPHHLEWMAKIGEIMASTLVSLKITEKTQILLEQFKQQTEQLRAQEEEMRQNLEEMEATQEEMRRKEQELQSRQQELQNLMDNSN